ncbi:MAG: type II/IV secretion system protein [Betaproteobacteria bacterium]|nr:type II/IV secretion system protein [Betaproteobacteria bacterium]
MQPLPSWQSARNHKLSLEEVVDGLVADGLVAADAARQLLAERRMARADQHPLVVVAEKKWKSLQPPRRPLHLEALTEWLAAKVDLSYFHIDPLKVDFSAVTAIMSSEYATRFKILPVAVTATEATIATAEPYLTQWAKDLSQMLRLEIRLVIANPLDIARYASEFFNIARSVKRAMLDQRSDISGIGNFEQLVEMGRAGKLDANEAHVVHIVDWLWQYAFEQRASDIHLEPRREMGVVRFRIDGVLHQVYQIPSAVFAAMTSRIKLLARMDVVEKRRPQDGRIKTKTTDGDEVELRLSSMPTAFGEKVVMRIFDPEVLMKDFRELGFSEDDVVRWDSMVNQPNGIILVTGPTGSGKTTTLYSTLKSVATPEVNVCTVEDPIEMVEPAFNQMQVQHNIGVDFASGIRTLMRQDPDIIMVGEIRDLETAEMAIQAALTGHLVFSTLHTNDAPSAITRLLDLGVPAYLIQSTVLGVLAQRLVRTLCPHCKEKGTLDEESWDWMVAPWKAAKPAEICQPAGCLECRMTGYLGRIGIYETLVMSAELKKKITAECDASELRDLAYREGMKPLRISGAMKVASGITTVEEVLKVAPPATDERRRKA